MANELKTSDKAEVKETRKKEGLWTRIVRFLKDYKGELKKITWPTAKQTAKNTGIVLAAMVVVGLFVVLLDLFFQQIINKKQFQFNRGIIHLDRQIIRYIITERPNCGIVIRSDPLAYQIREAVHVNSSSRFRSIIKEQILASLFA